MDEERIAVVVGGAVLTGIGIYVGTLPQGFALAIFSIVVGMLIFAFGVVRLIRDRTTQGVPARRSPHVGDVEPGNPTASLFEWAGDTPWGTTSVGLVIRVATPAGLTAVIAFAGPLTWEGSHPWTWDRLLVAFLGAAIAYLWMAVLPWLAHRWVRPNRVLTRRVELRALVPSMCVTALAAAAIGFGWIGPIVALLIAAAQLLFALAMSLHARRILLRAPTA
jgi:hypothetical protein